MKESKNLKEDFLNKDLLKSYLDFISNLTFEKDADAEKITTYIKECIVELAENNFFSQQFFDDDENYFLTNFSPSFLKKLSNESVTSKKVKENLWIIVNTYLNQMIKHLENSKMLELWESVISFFDEDKQFMRSFDDDASDKYLVKFYF